MTSRAPRTPLLVALSAAAALVLGLLVPAPAMADHTAAPSTVTLVGDLQSELGCPGDWQPDCAVTQLSDPDGDGTWTGAFDVPAGQYEYKVAINGSWDENYGAGGAANGANLVLSVAGTTEVTFSYDGASHVISHDTGMGEVDPELLELARPSLREDLTDEVFYFVLPDRFFDADPTNNTGGIEGDRLDHGYDPTDEGFYHGGDLAGLLEKIDYLEDMGVTAIWMAPVFENQPVQGIGTADVSAGYHGYWTLDFTQIDPHFGTNEELEALIDEAHSRDMKVFFDIITNHTADVIDYQEGVYNYISKASEPFRDADGVPFDDRDYAGGDTFPELDAEVSFPYTPVVPEGAPTKTPEWLNDTTLYHNRGNSSFTGENSVYGDFFGLDDLFTAHPDVVNGMIEIFKPWIDLGVDGFRIDTVKHVNIEFWQQWSPAIQEYARDSAGNEDFFMFGEVFKGEPEFLSIFTSKGDLPAVLDFGFQAQATDFAARSGDASALRDFFADDDYYIDADTNAYSLPTFLGNHDMGRIGYFISDANPGADDDELLARDRLAHALMYFSRGMPVVYSGDEQGFTGSGDGGDKRARQDMFPTQTPIYSGQNQIGTDATPDDDNFDPEHPLYTTLADLAGLTGDHAALRSGAQLHRYADDGAGVLAFSRVDRDERVEYLVVTNNAETTREATFATGTPGATFAPLWSTDGDAGSLASDGSGSVTVELPAFGAAVYRADAPLPTSEAAPGITVAQTDVVRIDEEEQTREALEFQATLDRDLYAEVTFLSRIGGSGEWSYAGTDDNAPYRVTVDTEELAEGTTVEVVAVVDDLAGNRAGAQTSAVVPERPLPPVGGLRDHLVVHYPTGAGGPDVDDLSLWTFGDIAPELIEQQDAAGWPNGLEWNGEDDYGVFRFIELDTSDDLNEEVGFIVVDSDGNKIGTEADRVVNPSLTPEVWIRPDDGVLYTSQAAAQGYVTVHYQRADGDYDGWGLHLWGDAIADGVATDWPDRRAPDGVDEFGAYWNVPIDDPDATFQYLIHDGAGTQTADQAFVPAEQPAQWIVDGDEEAYASRAAALDLAVIHYHRPDGDYGNYDSTDFNDFWGLHVWDGAQNPTQWPQPIKPVRTDRFGVVFEVPLVDGATQLAYILHRGDAKDLPADQFLDLGRYGHEVWILAGREGYLLPMETGSGEPGNLTQQRAHWLTRDIIAWDVDDAAATYSLVTNAEGGLELVPGGVGGDGAETVPLEWVSADLPAELAERYPHLAGYAALRVPEGVDVAEALKGALAVSATRGESRLDATGVQIPGVLDDLYADGATSSELGVSWDGDVPTVRLWAPTARSVTLHRFEDPEAAPPGTTTAMTLDETSGVWSVTGEPGWDRQFYLFEVEVFVPSTGRVERNVVTDPYSVSLATNSVKSQIVSLDDADLAPAGWSDVATQAPATPEELQVYELHVRDFSIRDQTVPADERGTYKAFTRDGSDGMQHLQELAEAGLTTVHLLPTFDIATIEEDRSAQVDPDIPADAGPDSEAQQAAVMAVADQDGFNWGYDPFHFNAPEGSYATDPQGTTRIVEFREMVQSLNETDLGVVVDVVYNHTAAAGQSDKSVLDKVVPGYYHRLLADGTIATSTCCQNTATEHAMMEKLMVDSVVLWAKEYKVDGFRFDLMGHHSKANMLAVREALDALTLEADGVDGENIYVYGEGWNFGEVENDQRFEQATQANMAGTGIGTFNDRLRDAVRGGGPFDDNPRRQGFGSGLYTDPNSDPVNGSEAEQRERLLLNMDQIKVGLAGNLRDYTFVDRNGETVTGAQVDYNGSPAGYTADPQENVIYVSKHDNETLFDSNAFKLPQGTAMADRVRMQQLALSTVALGQGVSFFHAGSDMLRSKSLDRNSYNSGDHFNVLDFTYATNNFGVGLPPAPDNAAKWSFMRPLLADPALKPSQADIEASVERFRDLMAVSQSTPLFSLTDAEQVQDKVSFLDGSEVPGLILMHLDDTVGEEVDEAHERVVVAFNATDEAQTYTVADLAEAGLRLHPVQADGADPVVKDATFDAATGTFTVPARTTAVFVDPTGEDPDPEPETITVDVQLRGGAGAAPVNPRSRGVLPFHVLSQDGFDPVADVDVASLRFGVTGTEDSVVACEAADDVNGDGVADLQCTARVQDTGVAAGDTALLLRGTTVDGDLLEGSAAIRTVGPSATPGPPPGKGNGRS